MERLAEHSPNRLGEKLRQIRESFETSQEEFPDRLGNPEAILQGSISGYERGKREPPLLILLKYARTANVSVDTLIDDMVELPMELPSRNNKPSD